MGAPTLVISNPPHGVCDSRRAAPQLGLTPAEATLKANYPVPEIWLALEDRAQAEAAARELTEAGLHVTVVAGEELRDVPPREHVRSFAFEETGVVLELEDLDVTLAYDAPIIAVFCAPRPAAAGDAGRPVGSRPSEAVRHAAEPAVAHLSGGFLDMYASLDGKLRRLSVVQGVTEFSGLGHAALPSAAGNLMKFVGEVEARFSHAQVDRRMALLHARRRTSMTGMTAPSGQQRKGFSYGTETLASLLASISPDLKDLSEFELSSRLAYLTRR